MLVVALGSGEPALTVANPMRFLHLKIDHFLFLICMLGNRRGTRAAARGRLTQETEGGWMLCHGPRRLGLCSLFDFVYNCVLEQVGSRGGQEEVLEFSKRTAAQVKAILAQGQVFSRTVSLMLDVVLVMRRQN